MITDGKPVEALLKLAARHGIETNEGITAEELSEKMQEKWLRKTEHQYQIPAGPPAEQDLFLLKVLNLVEAVKASLPQYDGVLVLGATVVAVRKRLSCLIKQYAETVDDEYVNFKNIYMLGGARPLDKEKEKPEVLCSPAELVFKENWTPPAELPTTEAGMMKLVFEQSFLPPEWQGIFIDTPLQPTTDGKTRHPNTADTVEAFLDTEPMPGKYLVVSSQPFVARQTMNVAQILKHYNFTAEGIGYEAPATTPLKTFLDETSRLLYEEIKASK